MNSLFRHTPFPDAKPPEREEKSALKRLRSPVVRYHALIVFFGLLFLGMGARMAQIAFLPIPEAAAARSTGGMADRATIHDRHGRLLADKMTAWEVFIRPRETARGGQFSPDQSAALKKIFPELDVTGLRRAVESGKSSFRYVARKASSRQWAEAQALGVIGLEARQIKTRVYPSGRIAAHILGGVDVDGKGIAGVERALNETLTIEGDAPDDAAAELDLTIDLRVQNAMRRTLIEAQGEFHALGVAGLLMNIRSGEVLAMVSLPDFDPNNRPQPPSGDADEQAASPLFNRVTQGTYDLGSVFKLLTAATALDSGAARIDTRVDASAPLRRGNHTIEDYLGKGRVLSLEEVIRYSSNIGAVRVAELFGVDVQRAYLEKYGLTRRVPLSGLPEAELARPLLPAKWDAAEFATVSYGHGISVSPLHLATAIASVANDGCRVRPTLLLRKEGARPDCERVVSSEVSTQVRSLMRLVARQSSGRSANIPGYEIGGKTGTAYKVKPSGGYDTSKRFNTFVALWPTSEPKYVLVVSMDDPKFVQTPNRLPLAGRTSAPVAGLVIQRIAPLLGEAPADRFRPQPSVVDELSEGGALPIFIGEPR